jgi:dihydroorotase
VFDPDRPWTLNARSMSSAGKNTPFDGWEFRGQVTHTLFHGRIVHRPES